MCCNIVISSLVLTAIASLVDATHFRGSTIQWKPVDPENFDGQIEIRIRIAWRRSSALQLQSCGSGNFSSTTLYTALSDNINCQVGCSGSIGNISFFCTDFNLVEDWVSGERRYIYNVNPTNLRYFEASFSSCCWISQLVIGRDSGFEVRVKGDLTPRSDGRINSSPVTTSRPIIRLQYGCDHVIQIPVQDGDGDTVRCRWANVLSECRGVCNAFPNAILDMDQCTITYRAGGELGWYAVALQIEDFLSPSSQIPLSSVPLQFLVLVFSSTASCDSAPHLVPGETPADGSCITVELNSTYTTSIVATSESDSIIDFPTASPRGLMQSAVNQSPFNSSLYYINITWTPTLEQFGINIFCFSATNSRLVTSEQSCITLLVGVQGPRILPNSISPVGTLSLSPSTVWSMTFDQPITRPNRSRFIRFFEKRSQQEVHKIDVTSPSVIFPASGSEGTMLTFTAIFPVTSGQEYYILIDGGAAVGEKFCGQDSHHITNSSFWTFRAASIGLVPRFGSMFGGTPVLVFLKSPINSTKNLFCSFGKRRSSARRINNTVALCVSPNLKKLGFIQFTFHVAGLEFISQFLSVSPERAHAVTMSSRELLLGADNSEMRLSWAPDQLIPSSLENNITVDISLYMQKYSSKGRDFTFTWNKFQEIKNNVPNDGEEMITIPARRFFCRYPLKSAGDFKVCPVTVKVSVSKDNYLPLSVGIWSGVAFLQSNDVTGCDLRDQCMKWSKAEKDTTPARLKRLRPCPPNQLIANFDIEYEREDRSSLLTFSTNYNDTYMESFHPNVEVCYRQNVPDSQQSGQQCCYNADGILVKESSAGGSADSYSPKSDYDQHLMRDLVPYILCCKSQDGCQKCPEYFATRPSGSEDDYMLPVPACTYGDPHIVTLDGHKYSFNGKGEFTLIETNDTKFVMQGRMESAIDASGSPAPGTVFTAIVARDFNTQTSVQFEVEGSGLQVLVNGELVTFDDVDLQEFDSISVNSKENNTVLAHFSNGVNIEIKVENEIISVMLIGLPYSMRTMTQGLMGNFNGIISDDLLPRGGIKFIPLDSSLEDIHNLFGITWIIDNEADSLFTYGQEESWQKFYSPNFIPMFRPTFTDPELEEEAKRLCGKDQFCLFDIAATKRVDIGLATLNGGQNLNRIMNLSAPIVCNPPCSNGVCFKDNSCSCNEGFEGSRCTEPILEECDVNFCANNATCVKQGLSYTCECPPGFIGTLCEEEEGPFSLRLINSSPRVKDGQVQAEFITSMPAMSDCSMNNLTKDCSDGRVIFSELPPGSYVLSITSKALYTEQTFTVERTVHISNSTEACDVHLINEGIVVTGRSVTILFYGSPSVDEYQCRLDHNGMELMKTSKCLSPLRYRDLDVGSYHLMVQPVGCGGEGHGLSENFNIN